MYKDYNPVQHHSCLPQKMYYGILEHRNYKVFGRTGKKVNLPLKMYHDILEHRIFKVFGRTGLV